MRDCVELLMMTTQRWVRRSRRQDPTERHSTMNNKHLLRSATCDGRVTTRMTFEGASSDVGIKTGRHRGDVDDFWGDGGADLLLTDARV